MKHFLKLTKLCFILLAICNIAQAQTNRHSYVPGELIVKFMEDKTAAKTNHLATKMEAKVVKTMPTLGIELWKIDQNNAKSDILELVEQYKDHPDIDFIEPNYLYSIDGLEATDDPKFNQQWSLHNTGEIEGSLDDADIDAPEAWEIQSDSSTIVIGILDTGIDWQHPDLTDNIWQNLGEDADGDGHVLEYIDGKWVFDPEDLDTIDNDNNGYVDDLIGWNFVDDNNKPFDYEKQAAGKFVQAHGTHVAGIIAASHNDIGVAGVAPNVKIAPLKFMNDNKNPSGEGKHAVEALNYAVNMGMQISNNSWGGGVQMDAIKLAIRNAGNNNHLFVASAGNEGKERINFPADFGYGNVISVANTNKADSLSETSNYNFQYVDIAAPGESILSCLPLQKYGYMSGTSMATPLVAGASAILWQKQLDLLGIVKYQNIKQLLLDNVDVTPHLLDKSYSGGRLNLHKSLVATLDTNYAYYRAQDSLNLISIYNALNGPNWEGYQGGLEVWDLYNKPINEWAGVDLDEFGRISSLLIKFKNLSGTIPPEIGNLTELRSIGINQGPGIYSFSNRSFNTITQSNIIDPYINKTEHIGFLGGYKNVTGAIPNEIGNLTKLRSLALEGLNLTGELPIEITNLKQLLYLNLGGNQLSGIIPPQLAKLTKLSGLNLYLNKLSGTIPIEISNLKNLSVLNLFYNQLEGSIPGSIASLPLWHIDLGHNNFEGKIPIELGTFQHLHSLSLDYNNLTGAIPPNLGRLVGVNLDLNLSNNQLSGCYDPSLILTGPNVLNEYGLPCSYDLRCKQYLNSQISDGNNFDAPWEDFVETEAGSCWASENTKVWPGDLNNDGQVGRDDIIFYGLAKGNTGPTRESAPEYGIEINNVGNTNWEAQLCPRWDKYIFGIDCKHQDANGDGIVDTLDYLTVLGNMGSKNPDYKESGHLRYVSEGFELVLEPIDDSAIGTTRAYNLFLKKLDDSQTSIYGISSTIKFNTALKDATIDFSNSCLDTLHSYKNFDKEKSTLEFALTQIDNVNINCQDALARIIISMEDTLPDTGGEFISFKVEAISSQANATAGREINETIGATAYSSFSINSSENSDLGINLSLKPQTCFKNGVALANVYGGRAPYQFLWSTGQTTQEIENLNAGSYTLTITDANNATIVIPFEIENEIILEYDKNGDLVGCEVETEIIEIEVEIETPCPDYIDFDENIDDGTNHIMESGTYQASKNIETNAKILTNEEVQLKAGEKITLKPGFSAENNTRLDIEIEDCIEQ